MIKPKSVVSNHLSLCHVSEKLRKVGEKTVCHLSVYSIKLWKWMSTKQNIEWRTSICNMLTLWYWYFFEKFWILLPLVTEMIVVLKKMLFAGSTHICCLNGIGYFHVWIFKIHNKENFVQKLTCPHYQITKYGSYKNLT